MLCVFATHKCGWLINVLDTINVDFFVPYCSLAMLNVHLVHYYANGIKRDLSFKDINPKILKNTKNIFTEIY